MKAGLGEIISSWLSLVNIAAVQKRKGHKVELIVQCTQVSYFDYNSVKLFFNLHTLKKYFDEIKFTDKVYEGKLTYINGDKYEIFTTDSTGIEHLYDLSANKLWHTVDLKLIIPDLPSAIIKDLIRIYDTEINNLHHVRVLDGFERSKDIDNVVQLVSPKLEDGDLILTNSSLLKSRLFESTPKTVKILSHPIEKQISNHYLSNTSVIPVDLLFLKGAFAFVEMVIGSKAKHLHRWTIYENQVSAFLIFNILEKTPHTEHIIPKETFTEDWMAEPFCSDLEWFSKYSIAMEEQFK